MEEFQNPQGLSFIENVTSLCIFGHIESTRAMSVMHNDLLHICGTTKIFRKVKNVLPYRDIY